MNKYGCLDSRCFNIPLIEFICSNPNFHLSIYNRNYVYHRNYFIFHERFHEIHFEVPCDTIVSPVDFSD